MRIRKGTLVCIKERRFKDRNRIGIVTKYDRECNYRIRLFPPLPRLTPIYTFRRYDEIIALAQVDPKFKSLKQILAKYHHLIIPRLIEKACN